MTFPHPRRVQGYLRWYTRRGDARCSIWQGPVGYTVHLRRPGHYERDTKRTLDDAMGWAAERVDMAVMEVRDGE